MPAASLRLTRACISAMSKPSFTTRSTVTNWLVLLTDTQGVIALRNKSLASGLGGKEPPSSGS